MNLIFDFDGTICDSFEITLKITNEYLTRLGKKLIDAKKFREEGIEEVLKDYKLNKLQILIYIFKGRRELSKYISKLMTFDNLPVVLRKLSKKNTLGIVSSNSKKNIEQFLKLNNIDDIFKFIVSSPTIFEKSKKIKKAMIKYKFERNETIYIGDEIRDIQAAKNLNIASVAVTWGFADEKLLKAHQPDFLIRSPIELLKRIK